MKEWYDNNLGTVDEKVLVVIVFYIVKKIVEIIETVHRK